MQLCWIAGGLLAQVVLATDVTFPNPGSCFLLTAHAWTLSCSLYAFFLGQAVVPPLVELSATNPTLLDGVEALLRLLMSHRPQDTLLTTLVRLHQGGHHPPGGNPCLLPMGALENA